MLLVAGARPRGSWPRPQGAFVARPTDATEAMRHGPRGAFPAAPPIFRRALLLKEAADLQALAGPSPCLDCPSRGGDDVLDDREPEPGAA
jgi:hypothetical protein